MKALSLDHLVLTVTNLEKSSRFYTDLLGMQAITFADNRHALVFGQQKINLHVVNKEIKPNADHATPGSADLCLIIDTPVDIAVTELMNKGIIPEVGPVVRTGASSQLLSIYIRDPDGNLLELANKL